MFMKMQLPSSGCKNTQTNGLKIPFADRSSDIWMSNDQSARYRLLLCLTLFALISSNSVMLLVNAVPVTFARELPQILQPPALGASVGTTFDSYGNLIEGLKPIQTPDGRKVISAQGVQFEIPDYASGITEIQLPSDKLLPPFVDIIAIENVDNADDNATQNALKILSTIDKTALMKLEKFLIDEFDTVDSTSAEASHKHDNEGNSGKSFRHHHEIRINPSLQRSIDVTKNTGLHHQPETPRFSSGITLDAQTTLKPEEVKRIASHENRHEEDEQVFDQYALPSWLSDWHDPDLNIPVTYKVPSDLHEYNHTLEEDILPPLQPYTDLSSLHVTAPTQRTTTESVRATSAFAFSKSTTATGGTVTPSASTISTTYAPFKFNHNHLNSFTSSKNVLPSTTSTFALTAPVSTLTSASALALSATTTPTSTTSKSYSNHTISDIQAAGNTNPTAVPTTADKNIFQPTIPPWLKDFDYPDVGPGVPFIYNPNENPDENDAILAHVTSTAQTTVTTPETRGFKHFLNAVNSHLTGTTNANHFQQSTPNKTEKKLSTTADESTLFNTKNNLKKTVDAQFLSNNLQNGNKPSTLTHSLTTNDRFKGDGGVSVNQLSGKFNGSFAGSIAHGIQIPTSLTHSTRTSTQGTQKSQQTNKVKYTGSFGGPPGILTPYDNLKTTP